VAASTAIVAVVFGAVFKLLPDVRLSWKHVRVGAVATAAGFTSGKYALVLYLRYLAPTSAFGAAGSLAAVMLWIYYSSFVFFFGAEFTKAWALRYAAAPVDPRAGPVEPSR
jgi:membrane protein